MPFFGLRNLPSRFLTMALLSHRGIAVSPWHCGLTVALQAMVGFTDRRCVELTAM